jgi:hypothetical protein
MPVRMFKLLQSLEASYKQYQTFCHHSRNFAQVTSLSYKGFESC